MTGGHHGRASGRDAGTSLIGLLALLAIMGSLAAVVVVSLGGQEPQATAPSGLVPAATGTETPVARGPAGFTSAASAAACRADVATLEAAMAAAHAARGVYPTSLTELRSSGFLAEPPSRPGVEFTPQVEDGRATGRILVNGLPGAEGCL